MNRKITLILALFILAVVSVSIVTAVNNTSDTLEADDSADDSISQDSNVDKVSEDGDDIKPSVNDGDDVKPVVNEGNGGLTVKKVWEDNDNAAGKRPSSVKFSIIENNDVLETGCEITESMGWQATLDLALSADSTYEIVEEDVPEGYTAEVSGNAEQGFVITNTLKEEPKNDTNSTTPDNPKNPEPKKETKVVTKTTTKNVPVKKEAKKDTKKTKDKHDTGNPILLGVLALSAAGLAIQLRRKE